MASRRSDSLGKLDKRLKALAKRLPESNEQFTLLLALGDSIALPAASDRAAALIAAQFVEYAAQQAIESHLAEGFDQKELFDGPGAPLGTLSAKIAMADGLGIVSDRDREDLDTIRNIRNAFAHSMTHIAFTSAEVVALCARLNGSQLAPIYPEVRAAIGPRKLFVTVAATLYFVLIAHVGQQFLRAVRDHKGP